MIVLLLSCSTSWCQNDVISLTGEVDWDNNTDDYSQYNPTQDSVLVAIDAIKIANAKMIELKYEKEENRVLRELVQNDSVLIDAISTNLDACVVNSEQRIKEVKTQRNILSGTSGVLLILLIISLL